jgi:hypothetical protein
MVRTPMRYGLDKVFDRIRLQLSKLPPHYASLWCSDLVDLFDELENVINEYYLHPWDMPDHALLRVVVPDPEENDGFMPHEEFAVLPKPPKFYPLSSSRVTRARNASAQDHEDDDSEEEESASVTPPTRTGFMGTDNARETSEKPAESTEILRW